MFVQTILSLDGRFRCRDREEGEKQEVGVVDVVECRSSKVPKKSAKASQSEYIDYFRWMIAWNSMCSEDASTVDVPACIKEIESVRSALRGRAFFHDALEELRSVPPVPLPLSPRGRLFN